MKQIKEDTEKNKQAELRRSKEIAQLRKEQLKKEGLIRNLENEKRRKDVVLKRKQEEVIIVIVWVVYLRLIYRLKPRCLGKQIAFRFK